MVTLRAVGMRCAASIVAVSAGLLAQPPRPVTVIAYGDMRFTDPSNVTATDPLARMALVERIAEEKPDAVLLNGDVPWHGGTISDYEEFRKETAIWRAGGLHVFPSSGNHEFSQCEPAVCLEHWWTAFPELRGKRWYSVDLTAELRIIAIDTMSPLLPDSEQRRWLEQQVEQLPTGVRFVLITLHHPPVADIQTRLIVDHNPRPNEIALATYLKEAARTSSARFVVIAGHVHNYAPLSGRRGVSGERRRRRQAVRNRPDRGRSVQGD